MSCAQFGYSLYDLCNGLSAAAENRRQQELAALKTGEDAAAHIIKTRERLNHILMKQEFPAGTSPAVITAQLCRNHVLVDKVLYEVRPGIFSTGLFFRPEKHNGNLPGVIGSCGHSSEGKGYADYQKFAFGLATKGFGVFLYDPPGQGERHTQIPGLSATGEHAVLGKALIAAGIQPASLFINDAKRAIDYLLSRPEIRPGGIAATGNSGGGQMTYYLFGMDERIETAACACHMNTMRTLFRNEIATDPESSIIGLLSNGSDRPDFAIAGAPKPLLLLGAEQDALDHRGLLAAYKEIQHIYRLLGKEENLRIHTCPGTHAYHRDLREAMYGFFTEHFFGKADCAEPELEVLSPEEFQVLPEGEVILHPGCRKETAFIRDEIAASRKTAVTLDEAGAFLRHSLRLPSELPEAPDYRVLRPIPLPDKRTLSRFALQTEAAVPSLPVLCLPEEQTVPVIPPLAKNTMLYVAHLESCREIAAFPAGAGERCFALDLRGTGTSRSIASKWDEKDYFTPLGREYFIECTSRMLDVPLTGGRVRDLCAALSLLESAGASETVLYGCGIGGITAAYAAAAYHLNISKLILQDVPESLDALLDTGRFRTPQSCIPFGMLRYFDFADLYRLLAERYQLELRTAGDVPPDTGAIIK